MALALIPVTAIRANPDQPRKNFAAEGLQELANSIRATGLQQPITLRPVGTEYEIVAGERRFRACKMLGLEAIPALVREMSDRQRDIEAIVENAIRLDVTPLEEARA